MNKDLCCIEVQVIMNFFCNICNQRLFLLLNVTSIRSDLRQAQYSALAQEHVYLPKNQVTCNSYSGNSVVPELHLNN